MSVSDAVNKPKFHHQWLPDVLYVEKDFPKHVIEQLEKMGYRVQEREAIGRTEVIRISLQVKWKPLLTGEEMTTRNAIERRLDHRIIELVQK